MDNLQEVARLLAASSDDGNPSPEQLKEPLEQVEHIGVIGLSRFPEKAARRVPSYLAARGYDIIPINPNAERIFGRTVFDRLSDVPAALDLVIVFRPSDEAGPYVAEAAKRPAIWLQQDIVAHDKISSARADGIMAIQDLCAFQVHRALAG
jgi:predicted CoA-binding protein